MLALPVNDWACSSSAGYDAECFGLVDLPANFLVSERLEEIMNEVHGRFDKIARFRQPRLIRTVTRVQRFLRAFRRSLLSGLDAPFNQLPC